MPATARIGAALLPLAATALTASTMIAAPATAATTGGTASGGMEPQTTLATAAKAEPKKTRVEVALDIMRNQQGDPYSYGSAGPNAFDCSGLVYYATHRAGFSNVPRTSGAQASFMRRISKSDIKIGDFVFFSDGGGVYHVGVWVGRNRILHAPYSGTRVRVDTIWTSSWFAGTLRGR
ncbi:MAG TPA: NlpC/P60 family protein [Nocardioidaceae bacterium]|nr:NlpC/P60 family protein [Nocardioidaceae bacterium]